MGVRLRLLEKYTLEALRGTRTALDYFSINEIIGFHTTFEKKTLLYVKR